MRPASNRRACRHCQRPMRSDARGPYCSSCRRLKVPCPDCGRPKMLTMTRCRRCHGRHNPFGRRTLELLVRTNDGRCRGVWIEGYQSSRRFVYGALPGCTVAWANLDHVHCSCGAPMAPKAGLCGCCTRRQLVDPFSGFCIRCGLESTLLFCAYCIVETQRELDGAAAAFRVDPTTLRDQRSEYVRASGSVAHVALHRLRF